MEPLNDQAKWSFDDGSVMYLLKEDELKDYPNGTIFKCIDGTLVTKGQDYIDNDTRGGYLAYGIVKD